MHFVSSLIGPIVLATPLAACVRAKRIYMFIVLFFLTVTLGISVEYAEWFTDATTGSTTYGELGQADDTIRDIIYDVAGAFIGSIIAVRSQYTKKAPSS